MMRNKENTEVTSKFDRNEKFTIENIPKSFESVTDEALKQIRRSAVERVERITGFKPSALQVTLQSNVDAQFGTAYNTLEGDYGTRRANLEKAYSDGFAELDRYYKEYKLQVVNHNIAFRQYSKANKVINGEELPDSLCISDAEMKELDDAIKKLNRRKYND